MTRSTGDRAIHGQPTTLPADEASAGRWVPPDGQMFATHSVPIDSLLPADSPRAAGEDPKHIRVLAVIETKLPPIIVHRQSMRVIDGMHRLGAAKIRGDENIEVQFFDGSEQEAFVIAVRANIAHGRPLSLKDRTNAAERIMASHPGWSDRSIADAAGISARMVAKIRQRMETEVDAVGKARFRVGRDGRTRPVDSAQGRITAAEVMKEFPGASLREIGSRAGISPATARDVRRRVQRGEDPVPATRGDSPRRPAAPQAPAGVETVEEPDLDLMLQGLRADPSLRLSESGRGLVRWVTTKVVRPGEWAGVSDELPPHATYILADIARRCADEWSHVAEELQRRARTTP